MSYSLSVPLRVCLCVRGNQCTARMCMLVHHPAVDSGSSCRLIYVPQVSIPWTMAWLQCITAATAMTPLWPHKVAPPAPAAWRELAKSHDADLSQADWFNYGHNFSISFILPESPSCKSSISVVQCITAPASPEDHGDDWCFSTDRCWEGLLNGCGTGLHAW